MDTTLQKTHAWLNEVQDLGRFPDRHSAFQALRSVLHALRDRLPVDEAAHFGAQLPVLVRGFYYEGWHPAGKPDRIRSQEEFLEGVESGMMPNRSIDPIKATEAVFELLNRRLSPGEPEKIRAVLPAVLQELWPEQGTVAS